MALNSADLGALGAVAPQLQANMELPHTQLGLLATASAGVGAAAAVPMGAAADRLPRVRLLVGCVATWSGALALAGAAPSYLWLLLSRLGLGAAAVAAGPLLSSLLGDLFPIEERARVLGWILTGEMLGAGVGLLVGGNIAAAWSWRWAFWLLSVPGGGLAAAVARWLPEPARGGASRLRPGAAQVPVSPDQPHHRPTPQARRVRATLAESLSGMAAALHIRTVRVLIVASAVGYFFFAGLRTFGLVFIERRFAVGPVQVSGLVPVIGVGAILGTMAGGRVADALLNHGHRAARIMVPAVAYISVAVVLAPALFTTSLWWAVPFITVAAGLLASANPPLDAARLDIVAPGLWGRAESLRTLLRMTGEATAPLCFGMLADLLAGPGGRANATGLRETFLIMLVPLAANGLLVLRGRSSYCGDVQAASGSGEARRDRPDHS
ncbi:MFS transporter [Luedemannella flava]